ncbi:PGPGW domain-containing protein [Serinicoccus kebangsaanensis]|uniref:PGPGW domain-containing protein n=1 Tax=Serinicoccus kebangsaanensis TaxID=2602069 RepID=UPI00192D8F1E|nr:PGPGW domain-containing protein [Serinicoccus kebangsaanensis]
MNAAKRIALETLGWVVLVAGVLALFLPGPGLLLTFAGLAILSTQYDWARRWTTPVKIRALRGAAEGVETIPRIAVSVLITLVLIGVGVVWFISPPPPGWWPIADHWWLFGGRTVAITMLASSAIAIILLVYSVVRFHGKPEARAEVDRMEADYKAEVARAEREDAHEEHLEAEHAAREAAEADRVADASEAAGGHSPGGTKP